MKTNLVKNKAGCTIMIIPDSAGKKRKNYHLKAGMPGFAAIVALPAGIAAMLVIALISFAGYHYSKEAESAKRISEQQGQMEQLTKDKEQMSAEKEQLEQEISMLNEMLNDKIEEEQFLQAREEKKHIPTGLPMDGAAGIKEESEEEQEGMNVNKRRKEIVFTAAAGTNVVATATGTVVSVMPDADYGNLISIDHGNGYISMYRNNGSPMVVEGNEVNAGSVLYVLKEDSLETGYSIRKDDVYINPMDMLDVKG